MFTAMFTENREKNANTNHKKKGFFSDWTRTATKNKQNAHKIYWSFTLVEFKFRVFEGLLGKDDTKSERLKSNKLNLIRLRLRLRPNWLKIDWKLKQKETSTSGVWRKK